MKNNEIQNSKRKSKTKKKKRKSKTKNRKSKILGLRPLSRPSASANMGRNNLHTSTYFHMFFDTTINCHNYYETPLYIYIYIYIYIYMYICIYVYMYMYIYMYISI